MFKLTRISARYRNVVLKMRNVETKSVSTLINIHPTASVANVPQYLKGLEAPGFEAFPPSRVDASSSSPVVGIQRNAAGFAQIAADEDPPLGGVRRGHGDGLVSGVCPVEVVLEPVQGQTHGGVKV